MSWSIFSLVLGAAVLHASWNALVKSGEDKLLSMTWVFLGASAVGVFVLLFFLPFPPRETWGYLLLSLAVHFGYKLCLIEAYRCGALGQVYPIARGGAPAVVLVLAFFFANEIPSTVQTLAVLLIAAGILSLSLLGGNEKLSARASLFAFASAGAIALYTLLDGLAARCCGAPHAYVVALMALDVVPLLILTCFLRRGQLLASARKLWRKGLIGGVLSGLAYWIVIYAMTEAPIASVAALRETSVVIATLIGLFVLHEKNASRRILPACLILGAVILLSP